MTYIFTIRIRAMIQNKRLEKLRSIYTEMDEARRKKMELLAVDLLDMQVKTGIEKLTVNKNTNNSGFTKKNLTVKKQ